MISLGTEGFFFQVLMSGFWKDRRTANVGRKERGKVYWLLVDLQKGFHVVRGAVWGVRGGNRWQIYSETVDICWWGADEFEECQCACARSAGCSLWTVWLRAPRPEFVPVWRTVNWTQFGDEWRLKARVGDKNGNEEWRVCLRTRNANLKCLEPCLRALIRLQCDAQPVDSFVFNVFPSPAEQSTDERVQPEGGSGPRFST